MKYKVHTLLFFLFWSIVTLGQNKEYQANYIIEEPAKKQVASKSQLEDLNEILKQNYTGGSLFSNQSPFVIIPSITIISEQTAGEVQVVKVIKLEIGLTSQGKDDRSIFNRFRHSYIITAEDNSEAIDKALIQFRKEKKIKTFFEQSNQNIVTFYESNCSTVLNTVKVNIERKEYLKAFNYLSYVPETTSCYKESEQIITKIFLDSKEESCRAMVQKALNEEAKRNYNKALYYLQFVETNTTCYDSATSLINGISNKIDEATIRNFEMEKLKFSKLTDLQKMEIIAKEVNSISLTIQE
ncbi:hypothetical protein LNQ81_11455 [Myroides sp. M-43]|uniref:hypothetical protein n=1 Tax=Myroides oncorhynchi TaxID=2893756 RepID=UPI001E556712|nr:hypothetical protein [Myroides oncorhynchi]MCC9043287.1 hypothetical protein [Myroides oncorhynchi]